MTLLTQLAQLEAGGLVRLAQLQPEVEYLFRHALVQDAAYASLVRADRRLLHQAAGEALERLYAAGDTSAALIPVLARHFAEAGDHARALRYYTQAAQAAAAVYANHEAIDLFGRALALATAHAAAPDTLCALYLQRGRAYELSAQDAAALVNYEALEAWARAGGGQPAVLAALNARATIYVRVSVAQNMALGHALSEQALALAQALGDQPGEAKALWNLLQHGLVVGRLAEAIAYGEQALALAQAHDLRETRAYVLTDLAKVLFQAGQAERAQAALMEARTLWRELGQLNMLADNLATADMVDIIQGRYAPALAQSAEAAHLGRQIGNLWNEAYAYYLVDTIHFERGDCGQALAIAERGTHLALQAGFLEGYKQGCFGQALIYGYLGDVPRALTLVRQAQAQAAAVEAAIQPWLEIETLIPLLYILNDRPVEAEAALAANPLSHDPAALQQQFILTQLIIIQVQAELALYHGHPAQAIVLIVAMIAALQHSHVRLLLPDALGLHGRALHAAGQLAEAQAVLDAARAEAEALGSRRSLWTILAALADLAVAQGHPAAAPALRQEAADILSYLLEHAGSDELRAAFRARPAVRALLSPAAPPPPVGDSP